MIGLRLAAVALGLFGGKDFLVLEHADDLDHGLRVVAGFGEIRRTETIGFEFVVAAVARGPGLRQRLHERSAGLVVHAGHQNRTEHRTHPCGRRRALLAHAVAGGDMTDLVTDHPREFRLRIEIGQDAARDVDIAAGQGERVDVRAVDHSEMPLQARPVALLRQRLADRIDIGLQRGGGNCGVFLQDILVRRSAHLDFLRLGHQNEIPVARDRILRAVGKRQHTEHGERDAFERVGMHLRAGPG